MKLSDTDIWLAIIGLVVVVFVTRNIFMVAPLSWQPRGVFERALRHSPLAALVALIVPSSAGALMAVDVSFWSVMQDGRLPSAIVALMVARLARSPFPGLIAGTAVLIAIGFIWP